MVGELIIICYIIDLLTTDGADCVTVYRRFKSFKLLHSIYTKLRKLCQQTRGFYSPI